MPRIYRHIAKHSQGYVLQFSPGHPRAGGGAAGGYVFEHILVVENAMRKHLRLGAEVHHVNGDKAGNRNQNLIACHDMAYHKLLHKRQAAYAACGNANWGFCRYCGKYDDPKNLRRMSPTGGTEHRSCKLAHRRAKDLVAGRVKSNSGERAKHRPALAPWWTVMPAGVR